MILRHNSTTIIYVWDNVAPILKKALEFNYDGLTLEDVFNAVLNDKGQLWVVENNNIVKLVVYTEIIRRNDGKLKLKLSLVAGMDLSDILIEAHAKIAEWAKTQGCVEMEGSGREGWRTFAKVTGYRHVYTTYRKGL